MTSVLCFPVDIAATGHTNSSFFSDHPKGDFLEVTHVNNLLTFSRGDLLIGSHF